MPDSPRPAEAIVRVGHHGVLLAAAWTVVIGASLWWNVLHEEKATLLVARTTAGMAFERDTLYGRWATLKGGVYAPVDAQTQPNPFLKDVPERDITTPSGKALTLVNPTHLFMEALTIAEGPGSMHAHVTSLRPVQPQNAPDAWEAAALRSFERGVTEVSSVEDVRGARQMRMMRPLVTEESCLKCHASQGSKVGDIRGGIAVAIPMEPLLGLQRARVTRLAAVHAIIWLLGCLAVALSSYRLRNSVDQRERAEQVTREERDRAQQYLDVAGALFIVIDRLGGIALVNRRACETIGRSEAELLGRNLFDAISPEPLRAGQKDGYARLIAGEVELREYYESPLCTKTGEERTVAWHNALLRDADGRPRGILTSGLDITERKRSEKEREHLIGELQASLGKVRQLSGLLPICAWCKKIRDDGGYWNSVEQYIHERSEAEFSHGLCPECERRVRAELDE
jgi:PAS domain S-box-containing protein